MAGYIIHIAIAKKYLEEHPLENEEEFIQGVIFPDKTDDKKKTHYGKSPAYTNLKTFLENNKLDTSFKRGHFMHLITDYLFYNYYLESFSKKYIYHDYDVLNKELIKKYEIKIPENVKNDIFFETGTTHILNMELACKIIDEISQVDLEQAQSEIMKNSKKWSTYKNIV